MKPYQITLLEYYLNWKNEPLGYFSVLNFLSQVFEQFLNEFEENKDPLNYEEMRLFHSVLDYIHTHYVQSLTVNEIAGQALINKNRLTRQVYVGVPIRL